MYSSEGDLTGKTIDVDYFLNISPSPGFDTSVYNTTLRLNTLFCYVTVLCLKIDHNITINERF